MSNQYAEKCPIWDLPCEIRRSGGRAYVNSPRAGGHYEISDTAESDFGRLKDTEKARLTSWLVDQRRTGNKNPYLSSYTVPEALRSRELSVVEKRDRLIEWVQMRCVRLGKQVFIGNELSKNGVRVPDGFNNWMELSAYTDSVDVSEPLELAQFAIGSGLIDGRGFNGSSGWLSLTFDGHVYLDEIQRKSISLSQAFVAMWFGQQMDEAFEMGFKPAIEDSGYQAFRIDRKDHNNKIDDEIVAEIRRSRFVVADFTSDVFQRKDSSGNDKSEAISRGGVYFEAGFAKGLDREVIWTARNDLIELVHFDTRQFNHITWATPEELRDKLSKRISATLGDGPLRKSK